MIRLGDLLVDAGLITFDQLKIALSENKKTGEKLGSVLKRLGYITEDMLTDLLSKQLNIPKVNLIYLEPPLDLKKYISKSMAEENKIVPVKLENDVLTIAMEDPLNFFVIDLLKTELNLEIEVFIANEAHVNQWIKKIYYETATKGSTLLKDMAEDESMFGAQSGLIDADDSPVVKLVDSVITEAVRSAASDIHFDPSEDGVRIRIRIDGLLVDLPSPPNHLKAAILSRLKVMANLDIAEKRVPQDGRISTTVDNKGVDIRVATLPTIYGEKIVFRVLDKENVMRGLKELGMGEKFLKIYREAIRKPQGVVMVTGPTGSGKTSTLYASLSEVNTVDKNIITVEDPVEYELSNINQVQVNTKTGMTFAKGLRSILRQDPDIIMVGEIRDSETAKIAIQSALTGHLVFSTLHTLNASGTYSRIINMDVEPYLVASAIDCVIAQRLVRKICPRCVYDVEITPEIQKMFDVYSIDTTGAILKKGEGCNYCNHTGYSGRSGVYELIITNDEIRDLILRKASTHEIRRAAKKTGTKTLKESGLHLVLEGTTTIAEVLRVTTDDENLELEL